MATFAVVFCFPFGVIRNPDTDRFERPEKCVDKKIITTDFEGRSNHSYHNLLRKTHVYLSDDLFVSWRLLRLLIAYHFSRWMKTKRSKVHRIQFHAIQPPEA